MATTTHWVMPDGSHRFETTEECPDCGHHHSPTWGGICVGCPCPNIRTEESPRTDEREGGR
jgi:hypothetical protein